MLLEEYPIPLQRPPMSKHGARTRALAIRLLVLGTFAVGIQEVRGSDPEDGFPPPASAAPLSQFPELRAATEKVTLGGMTLSLEAHLWRDFQPLSPPDGKPLNAVLLIRTGDGKPVTSLVNVDAAWVVRGDLVWAATVVERQDWGGERGRFAIRGGPKWGPGATVDVIVRVRDEGGRVALVISRARLIERTA